MLKDIIIKVAIPSMRPLTQDKKMWIKVLALVKGAKISQKFPVVEYWERYSEVSWSSGILTMERGSQLGARFLELHAAVVGSFVG